MPIDIEIRQFLNTGKHRLKIFSMCFLLAAALKKLRIIRVFAVT
jgi:hypothetical protein